MEQLREAVTENEQLNQTLKLELGVYDKMAADGQNTSAGAPSLYRFIFRY